MSADTKPAAVKVSRIHIEKEWSEGHPDKGGDGYWISLKSGWKWAGDPVGSVHSIHEDTKREAKSEFVMARHCPDCVKGGQGT